MKRKSRTNRVDHFALIVRFKNFRARFVCPRGAPIRLPKCLSKNSATILLASTDSGNVKLVQKGTRQSVKPNQLSIHPSLYKGTMQIYCPAQEQIAHIGQEKCRRHASQVSELRGQHRIRRICYPRPDFRLELKR